MIECDREDCDNNDLGECGLMNPHIKLYRTPKDLIWSWICYNYNKHPLALSSKEIEKLRSKIV